MTRQFKYVIFDNNTAIIFPTLISHDDTPAPPCRKRVSAGFLQFDEEGKVLVYGHSQSLHLASRQEDAEIIRKFLFEEEKEDESWKLYK